MKLFFHYLYFSFLTILDHLRIQIKLIFHGKMDYLHGNDTWMRPWDRCLTFKPNHKGLILSPGRRLSLKDTARGTLIVAPVGGGKSAGMFTPNILEAETSFIATDPSGELFANTSAHLKGRGYSVQILDTESLKRSFSFNPLDRARTTSEGKMIADILVTSAFPDAKGDLFWNNGAKNLTFILLRLLMQQEYRFRNLHNLKFLLDKFGSTGGDLLPLAAAHPDPMVTVELQSFLSQTEKIRLGVLATGKSALEKFADPELAKLCSGLGSKLDIASLRKQKTAIFLCSREDKLPRLSFLYRLLYAQVFEELMRMPEPEEEHVILYLDEFANIGKIPNFEQYATVLRKRRASIVAAVQSISQVEAVYGKKQAETIIGGGLNQRIFYPALDLETCTRISKMLGNTTVHFRQNERYGSQSRPLMTPTEIRTMPDSTALFLSTNRRPLRFRIKPFFKNPRQLAMTKKHPVKLETGLDKVKLEYLPLGQSNQKSFEDVMDGIEF